MEHCLLSHEIFFFSCFDFRREIYFSFLLLPLLDYLRDRRKEGERKTEGEAKKYKDSSNGQRKNGGGRLSEIGERRHCFTIFSLILNSRGRFCLFSSCFCFSVVFFMSKKITNGRPFHQPVVNWKMASGFIAT